MNSFNYICQNSVNLFQDGTFNYTAATAAYKHKTQHKCAAVSVNSLNMRS